MRHLLVCVLSALAFAPAIAADEYPADLLANKDVLRLKPVTAWNIEYADQKCRLSRMFGEADSLYLLYLEQVSPNPVFTLAAAGPEMEYFQRGGPLKLGFADTAPAVKIETRRELSFEKLGSGILMSGVRLPQPNPDAAEAKDPVSGKLDRQAANAVERIVMARASKALSFETGRLGQAFDALNTCTSDLIRQWGFDPDLPRPERSPEPLNILSVAKRIQENYPPGAARKGESGMFNARLVVEADGSVSECHLDATSITEALKPTACRELRRLHFKPALGSDGQPMRWYYNTSITYLIR
jgi:hypothetical protein